MITMGDAQGLDVFHTDKSEDKGIKIIYYWVYGI